MYVVWSRVNTVKATAPWLSRDVTVKEVGDMFDDERNLHYVSVCTRSVHT